MKKKRPGKRRDVFSFYSSEGAAFLLVVFFSPVALFVEAAFLGAVSFLAAGFFSATTFSALGAFSDFAGAATVTDDLRFLVFP